MQFLGNLAKSYVGAPLPEGWRPHLVEMLDPNMGMHPVIYQKFMGFEQNPVNLC